MTFLMVLKHALASRQKLLILFILSFLFIGCATKKIYYTEDKFYPQNSRYHTDWLGGGSNLNIRFIKRSNDKIYVQARYMLERSFYVENTDTVSFKFKDGSILSLRYDGYISQPFFRDFSLLYLETELKEITEWGTLEYIRADTSLGYENVEVISAFAEYLLTFYNRLKNNEYDELAE